jgi:hypothetical protein
MDTRKLYEAAGVAAMTFVSAMAIYKGFSEITFDAVYQPLIQALIAGGTALGLRNIPSKHGQG